MANGSLEELRAGVASTLPGAQGSQRLTLEEIFLSIVGAGTLRTCTGAVVARVEPGLEGSRNGHSEPLASGGGVFSSLALAQYSAPPTCAGAYS